MILAHMARQLPGFTQIGHPGEIVKMGLPRCQNLRACLSPEYDSFPNPVKSLKKVSHLVSLLGVYLLSLALDLNS